MTDLDGLPKSHKLLHELVTEYGRHQKRRGLSDSAVRHGRYKVIDVARFVHPKHVLDATEDDLIEWADQLDVAASTRGNYIAHIRSFYAWAVRRRYIDINPTDNLEKPRLGRRVPRPIDDDSLGEAWDEAKFGNPDPRMAAILALMAYQGARCIEVSKLRWQDITVFRTPAADGSVGTITLRGKGNKDRTVPLHLETLVSLEEYQRWRHEQSPEFSGGAKRPRRGYVFCRFHGLGASAYYQGRVGEGYISTMVSRHLPPGYTAHQLRHWFGTWLYRNCRDLLVVQETMGHADPGTTAGYAQADTSRAGPAVAGLAIQSRGPRRGLRRVV